MSGKREIMNNKAVYTYLISFLCLALWLTFEILIANGGNPEDFYVYAGAPSADKIYAWHLYGLITNSLVHASWIHFSLNIVAFLLLGSFVEKRITRIRFMVFGLFFSFITSLWQLSLSGDAGIGLSGVNMSLLGFIIGKSWYDERFRIPHRYILFFVATAVIAFCMAMNYFKAWNVGNAAMLSGLICGILTGIFSTKKLYISIISLFLIAVLSSITFFYSPWSVEWTFHKGTSNHQYDLELARSYYIKTLNLDPEHKMARENLKLLQIDEYSETAYQAHTDQNYSKARKYYLKILAIDKNNEYARSNIQALP